jgi:glycosyltransferase involved in cell wall biosynthesis
VEHLAKECQFDLMVMGAGPLQGLLSSLSATARERVRYLGFKQREELPDYFTASDVLLFPSRYDGWGMTAVEAMAAGMPVIGSIHAGSCMDLISDGINGFLVNPFQPQELEARMKYFITHPDEATAMGRLARRKARLFDTGVGGQRFVQYVQNILKN